MIKEYYELTQQKNNGEGDTLAFSASISTLSQKKMLLKITRKDGSSINGVEQDIELRNEDIFVLLKLLRMPAINQVNNANK